MCANVKSVQQEFIAATQTEVREEVNLSSRYYGTEQYETEQTEQNEERAAIRAEVGASCSIPRGIMPIDRYKWKIGT